MQNSYELAEHCAEIVRTGREDDLVLNLDLPVMHQFLNVEGIRKYHGIEITDQEWIEFLEDYNADIVEVWREVFLRFLRERPEIKTLYYPASEAPRNAGHPSNVGRPSNPFAKRPAMAKDDEEHEIGELADDKVQFLKEIQGLEPGE